MNQENAIEQYLQSLKAMGLSEEMIAMYRQQMAQSMNMSNEWMQQLNQFGQNIQQFNQLFTGETGADEGHEVPEDIELTDPSTLTTEEQWAVACGADLAFQNGQYLNDLTTGLSKQDCRQLLSTWWDIDSKEELLETTTWLFNEGHRIAYDTIWLAINTVSIKESKQFIREYVAANKLEEADYMEKLRNMRDALELFREKQVIDQDTQPDMLIWDYARVINLARGGFDAGYISREEALALIMACVPNIRKMYTSWKQLSISYQFARCVWNGTDGTDLDAMLTGMQVLLTHPKSPWITLPWHS